MGAVLVGMLLVAGVLLRAWIFTSDVGRADADEAVVGLMAGDVLDGNFEAFFWGQEYGGAQEAFVVAGLLAVGLPDLVALKAAPMLLFAGAAVLVWRIARRLLPDRDDPHRDQANGADETDGADANGLGKGSNEWAARVAGALFWATPAGGVWMSTKERGFYGVSLVVGLLAVLLALRLDERWTTRDAVALGAVAGAGWYASPQAGYLVIPAVVWLAVRVLRRGEWRAVGRSAPWMAAAGVVAAAPWLVANAGTGFASLSTPPGFPGTGHLERLELFFRRGLPVALGARSAVVPAWIAAPFGQALYLACLGASVAAVVLAVRKRARLGAWALVIGGVLLYPMLFAFFPSSFTVNDARYVTLLMPLVALLAAMAVARLAVPLSVALVAGVLAVSVVGVADTVDAEGTPGLWDVSPGDAGPLVAALRDRDVDLVFADYWIAHRLAFETDERVIASPFEFVRHPPYEEAVRGAPRPAYVVFRGTDNERQLGDYLGGRAIPFERTDAGIFVIYEPGERVLPEQVSDVWKDAPGRRPYLET